LRLRPGTLLRNLRHACRRSGLGQRRTGGRTRLRTCSIPTTSRSTKLAPAKSPEHRRVASRTRRNESECCPILRTSVPEADKRSSWRGSI
jgi:hypothetical protein